MWAFGFFFSIMIGLFFTWYNVVRFMLDDGKSGLVPIVITIIVIFFFFIKCKKSDNVKISIWLLSFIISFFFFSLPITFVNFMLYDKEERLPLIFFALMLLLNIFLFLKQHKIEKVRHIRARAEQERLQREEEVTLQAKHHGGLPLAQAIDCTLYVRADHIQIDGGNNTFLLEYAKMTDLSVMTQQELVQYYAVSANNAMSGGMHLPQINNTQLSTSDSAIYYIIFTYRVNNTISYLSFLTQERDKAQRWSEAFRSTTRTSSDPIIL